MAPYDENNTIADIPDSDPRLKQLLQVWRDYYDEIFEVDLKSGSFGTMMESKSGRWPTSGFAEIEVIVLAEKLVHPDDKAAFREFFDLDGIARRIREGIFVTKLNFRLKSAEGDYTWVKVKNIVPSKIIDDTIKFFACFRRVDDETGEDLRYKQELVDALEAERAVNAGKDALIKQVSSEIRSPLNGIIGMAGIAKEDISDSEVVFKRFRMIEEEAIRMSRVLGSIIESNPEIGTQVFEFEDHPINKISYGRRKEEEEEAMKDDGTVVPEHFAYISKLRESFSPKSEDEFVFSGKHILFAENNKLSIEVMQELFGKAGAAVDIVESGKEAVIKYIAAPEGSYDLVLMDTDLPELDGCSAAKCIRMCGKESSESVPIIAVSANASKRDIVRAYKHGFNAFFAKPVDFEILFTVIGEQLYGVH